MWVKFPILPFYDHFPKMPRLKDTTSSRTPARLNQHRHAPGKENVESNEIQIFLVSNLLVSSHRIFDLVEDYTLISTI